MELLCKSQAFRKRWTWLSGPPRKEEGRGWHGQRGILRAGCRVRWPGTCRGSTCAAHDEKQRLRLERGPERFRVKRGERCAQWERLYCQGEEARSWLHGFLNREGPLPQGSLNVILTVSCKGIRPGRVVGTSVLGSCYVIRAGTDKSCRIAESECVESYIYMEFQSSHSTVVYIIWFIWCMRSIYFKDDDIEVQSN